ncbi:hypothetical protein KC364_g15012 [Hortaea werneckii]|nr:hypothetical protein KC350_g14832 [Hortaea werneckii]KAI7434139.1 hypothetical protein KC364_g15012 [Hortaea werneckii]
MKDPQPGPVTPPTTTTTTTKAEMYESLPQEQEEAQLADQRILGQGQEPASSRSCGGEMLQEKGEDGDDVRVPSSKGVEKRGAGDGEMEEEEHGLGDERVEGEESGMMQGPFGFLTREASLERESRWVGEDGQDEVRDDIDDGGDDDDGGSLSVQGESMVINPQQQRESPSGRHFLAIRDEIEEKGEREKRVRFADLEEKSEGGQDDVATTVEDTGSMESGALAPYNLAAVVNATLQRNAVLRQDTPGPESKTVRALEEDLDDLKKDMDEVQKDRAHWRIKATKLIAKLGELNKWKKAKEQEEMEQRAVATQKIEEAVKIGTVKRIQEMKMKNEGKISTLEQGHKAKLEGVNAAHAEALLAKEEKWKKFKDDLTTKHEALKENFHQRHEGNKKRLKERLDKKNDELKEAKENFAEEKKRLRLEQQEAIKAAKPETNAAIKSKDSLLKAKDQTISQLEHQLEDSQTQITSLKNHIQLLEEARTYLSTQLSSSQTLILTLQETISHQTQQHQAETESHEREKLHREEALATARAEFVRTLDHERRSARLQYDVAQGAKAAQMDLQRTVFALRTALEGRDGRLEGLGRENAGLRGRVEELEGRLSGDGRGRGEGLSGDGLRNGGREVGDSVE